MEPTNADHMWSTETYRLKDIVDRVPTLVKVAEGIYGDNEATSFSQGDLIRLDSCAPLQRISAYLAQPGRYTRFEKFGKEINLPYNYNGRVQVQPMHKVTHEYSSVSDLIAYFPRYVRVQKQTHFQHPPGYIQTLEEGDVLTLKAVRRNQNGFTHSLRCTREGKDIILPRELRADFQVLPDTEEQSIRDVVETYKLPQCVRFIGRGVKEIMSKDLQEAVDNMAAFSGEMIIMGKTTSPPVLFGHYKGVGSVTANQFWRRAAVVIPLHSKHVEDLEVHLPVKKQSNNYEQFLVKVFPANSESSSILEDALYADFSTTSNIHFLSSAVPTDEQRKDESKPQASSEPPPPLPPRVTADTEITDDSEKNRPLPTLKVAPFCLTKPMASVSEVKENSKPKDAPNVKSKPLVAVVDPKSSSFVLQSSQDSSVKPAQKGKFIQPTSQSPSVKPQGPLVKATQHTVQPQDPLVKATQQSPVVSTQNQSQAPIVKPKPKSNTIQSQPTSPGIKSALNNPDIRPTTTAPVVQQQSPVPAFKAATMAPEMKPIPKHSFDKPTPRDSLGKKPLQEPLVKPTPNGSLVKPTTRDFPVKSTSRDSFIKSTQQDSFVNSSKRDSLVKSTSQDRLVKTTHQSKTSSLPPSFSGSLVGEAFCKLSEEGVEEDLIYEMPVEDEIYETIDEKSEAPPRSTKPSTYGTKVKRVFSDLRRIKLIQKFTPASLKNQPDDGEYAYIRTNNVPISELGISELCAVLNDCGMSDFARVCKNERVDGGLFVAFTPEIMKNRPFGLSEWNLIKAQKIQNGWMPKE